MTLIIKDRVKDTSTSTGTGDITTSGTPPTGFRGFDGVMETSDTSVIAIHHQTTDEWEICKTVYSGSNVLTRGTLLASSTGSRIDFSAGTKDVWIDLAADQVVDLDRLQTLTNKTIDLDDNTITGRAPYLGQVATRARVPNTYYAGNDDIMSRTRHIARDKIASLKVAFPNWYIDGTTLAETAPGGDATITASIEYPAGTFYQLKFSGSASGTIPDGETLLSDECAVDIPDGAEFWVRSYFANAVGIVYDTGIDLDHGEVAAYTGTPGDLTMGGTIVDGGASGGAAYFPCAIVATTSKPSVLIVGDSRAFGAGGEWYDESSSTGTIAPSIQSHGYINAARGSDQAQKFVASHANRVDLAAYCSDVIVQHGTNDFHIGSRTYSELKADIEAIIGYFPDQNVWLATIEPESTSTDDWATVANQTTRSWNSDRTTFNDAVRAGSVAGAAGYFEVADWFESSRNSGLWRVTGEANGYTSDGIHSGPAANKILAQSGAVDERRFALITDERPRFATRNDMLERKATNIIVSPAMMNLVGLARPNKIVNGDFDIWQRGTSQTSNGYGSADHWKNQQVGSTKTASRQAFTLGQTDVPGNPLYYLRTAVTSVAGSGNGVLTSNRIEGVRSLAGKTATLTFWAKADAARPMALEIRQYFGSGGSPSTDVRGIAAKKFGLTSSWRKFSIAVAIPSISGKTLGTGGNDYLEVNLWFDAGSDFDDWVDTLGQQSGTFDIAHVSLVEGDATGEDDPFTLRHAQQELALCQRYYYRMGGTENYERLATGVCKNSTTFNSVIVFPVSMRAPPSLSNGGNLAVEITSDIVITALAVSEPTERTTGIQATVASGLTAGNGGILTANNDTSAYIAFDAEL